MRTNIFFGLVLILVDQFAKYIIRIKGGFYICNENAAFGIELPRIIFYSFWSGLILTLIFFAYKKYFVNSTFWVALILSGAISNIIDRFVFGCVIDFIDLKFWPASIATQSFAGWPVFNLADVYITVGVVFLAIGTLRNSNR